MVQPVKLQFVIFPLNGGAELRRIIACENILPRSAERVNGKTQTVRRSAQAFSPAVLSTALPLSRGQLVLRFNTWRWDSGSIGSERERAVRDCVGAEGERGCEAAIREWAL